jgi:rSAM/selenodomain-associated transferase 2
VIVPVLDEETRILRQLDDLALIPGLHEVIVVDGRSTDRTVELARTRADVRVLSAPRGRAPQMNAGAGIASGEVFVFLHADVSLPQNAARWITEALADPTVVAGAFRTWTTGEGGWSWVTPLLHLADLRSRYTRLPYGDQALFVRADVFRVAGGFPDQPIMEDLELSRRLSRLGRVRTVPATVRVSGRRFLARPFHSILAANLFPLLYRLGFPPQVLADLYGNPR